MNPASSGAAADNIVPFADPDGRPQPLVLRDCVAEAMRCYFESLEGQPACDVYAMVLTEVEAPLLTAVLAHTRGNQTQAAELLGLNRGTLRKKFKQYNLLSDKS